MYAPPAVNSPSFSKKNQSYADLVASYHGLDAQGGYAISNHIALLGNWYWRRGTNYGFDSILYKRHSAGLGLTYYTPLEKRNHLFFNTAAGYDMGRFFMEENAKTRERLANADSMVTVNHLFRYDAHMQRFWIQPALVFNDSRLKTILSIRWAGTFYTDNRGTSNPNKYGHVSNKLLSYIEPALTTKIFVKDWWYFTLQAGAAINTQHIDYDYRGFIGNIGIGVDPASLFRRRAKKFSSTAKVISL